MKCSECSACIKGWFSSKPDAYVCTGVKVPFIVKDITKPCTQYKDEEKNMKEFTDKLIEKLEEEQAKGLYDFDSVADVKGAWGKAIQIVNQLAEEYKL